jgi:hypothetical protein
MSRAGSLGCAPGRTWVRAVLIALLLVLPGPGQAAELLRVKDAKTRLVDRTYVLDAQVEYAFSPEALEALGNGVPLTFLVHVQVRRADAWVWEDSLADLQLRYALRYLPLSERYEVYRLPGEQGRAFVSRDAAIAALGEIRNLYLVDADRLDPERSYEVQIKVKLDVEELPLPLRPIAYLRPAWKLASPWSTWPLVP